MSDAEPGRAAALVRRIAGWLAVLGAIALLVTWILSLTALSNTDKYGRVDIPGQAVLSLPEGELEVSFRTLLATNNGGGAINLPPLSLGIRPAEGEGPDPEVEEDIGTTTSVNGDAHVRVWTVTIDEGGAYRVTAGGKVNGYIRPQLTLGASNSVNGIMALLGIAIAVLLATAIGAHLVVRRSR
jgi:hypothetical protein